ncbi:MAG: hypothetical protein ABI162_18200 [Luteolibacter sp.]
MKRNTFLLLVTIVAGFGIPACSTDEPETKPVSPVSDTSKIPWNSPVGGQGQGQFGMMPQNQYRR